MRYVIKNNSGCDITNITNKTHFTDLNEALSQLESLVMRFPSESGRTGGFILVRLYEVEEVVARYQHVPETVVMVPARVEKLPVVK